MSLSSKATHVDRDDFDADHYADFIRDIHRSQLTIDQLDIARRQLRKKENLLARIHQLKMKEHIRMKNDFIRKIEQDARISKLPSVKETLKAQQRPRTQSPPLATLEHQMNSVKTTTKPLIPPISPRTQRLKANWNKFNDENPLVG